MTDTPFSEKVVTPKDEEVALKELDMFLATVDVDKDAKLPDKYKVQYLPTVFGIVNKKEVGNFVGLKKESDLKAFIDKMLI